MFNQHGFQFQDWNNFNNNTYCGGRGGHGRGCRGERSRRRGAIREKKYCWTHGIIGHNKRECNNPAQGHQDDATLVNCMGSRNQGCLA